MPEQGMALRTLVQHRGQLRREGPLTPAPGHIQGHRGCGQRADHECGALLPHPQILRQGIDRVGRRPRRRRAIGGEHQQAGRIPAPRHVRQPLQSGGVAPVQVFQHQAERPLGRQALQGLGQLPQQAGLGGVPGQAQDSVTLGHRQQRRHLRQPARGVLPQPGQDVRPLGPPAQAPQRFQHGEIRLARTVLLDALAMPDPGPAGRRDLGHEGLHQGGFAHPRLAREEAHLPRALPSCGVPAVQGGQLRLTAHHAFQRRARRGQGQRWRWDTVWGRRGVRHDHLGYEPQPVAVHGLNHALRTPIVAYRPAHRLDAGGQGLLPDVLVGPHLRQHFVAAHHPVALLNEIHQDLKDFAPQR